MALPMLVLWAPVIPHGFSLVTHSVDSLLLLITLINGGRFIDA